MTTRPLCESKGCPNVGLGYVESDGVWWLGCENHGGDDEVARLRRQLRVLLGAIDSALFAMRGEGGDANRAHAILAAALREMS